MQRHARWNTGDHTLSEEKRTETDQYKLINAIAIDQEKHLYKVLQKPLSLPVWQKKTGNC